MSGKERTAPGRHHLRRKTGFCPGGNPPRPPREWSPQRPAQVRGASAFRAFLSPGPAPRARARPPPPGPAPAARAQVGKRRSAGAPPPRATAQPPARAARSCVQGTWGRREVSAGQRAELGTRLQGHRRHRGPRGRARASPGAAVRGGRGCPPCRSARAPRGPRRRPEVGAGLGRGCWTGSAGPWGSAGTRRRRGPLATGPQMWGGHDDWAEV